MILNGCEVVEMFPLDLSLFSKEEFKKRKPLKVFRNQGTDCHYCGKKAALVIKVRDKIGTEFKQVYTQDFELMTIDHIVPKSQGGSGLQSNLVPCCHGCNLEKQATSYDNFLRKKERFRLKNILDREAVDYLHYLLSTTKGELPKELLNMKKQLGDIVNGNV